MDSRKRKQPELDDTLVTMVNRLESNLKQSLSDWKKDFDRNMCDFNSSVVEMKNEIGSIRAEYTDIKNQISELSDKHDVTSAKVVDLEAAVGIIEEQHRTTDHKISHIEQELKSRILVLEKRDHDRDQYSRMNNVEISGIPSKPGENLFNILKDLCAVIGFNFNSSDIDYIHRVRTYAATKQSPGAGAGGSAAGGAAPEPGLQQRHPHIVVRWARRRCREEMVAAARLRRHINTAQLGYPGPASNVYVNEHLTPANKLLLKEARDIKNKNNYDYLWVKNGKIIIRKSEKHRSIVINSASDLNKIK